MDPDDLGRVRVARSTMDAHELVKDGGPKVYEWLNSIQYAPWRDPGNITASSNIAEWKQAQARKFEVPDRMKPYVGADTITPEEASFICQRFDFDDYEYSDPSEGFIHNVNDVYWPFRDVWWACSDSSIIRQFDATKKFASTPSGRGGYSGEFSYPLWGNEAYWEYYAHGRAVLLVEIRPAGDAQTSTDSPRPLADDL